MVALRLPRCCTRSIFIIYNRNVCVALLLTPIIAQEWFVSVLHERAPIGNTTDLKHSVPLTFAALT